MDEKNAELGIYDVTLWKSVLFCVISEKNITEMTCLRNLVEVECCITTLFALVFKNGLVNGQGAFTQIEHFYFAWNNLYDNVG